MPQGNGTSSGELRIERKIPGGKLLACRAVIKDGRIASLNFLGDFFLHPEEAVEELEAMLQGKDGAEARAIILDFLGSGVEMGGVSPKDFADILDEIFRMAGSE